MKSIDFNSSVFKGFEEEESILLDTGSLLAYFHKKDAWHKTVSNLFDNHIFNNSKTLFLYVNPTIINEVLHRSGKPLDEYLKAHPSEKSNFTHTDKEALKKELKSRIKELIVNEVLIVLKADKDAVINQIDLTEALGAADATNASFAHYYGISFLTVDSVLVRNIEANKVALSKIQNIYYTHSRHRTFHTK